MKLLDLFSTRKSGVILSIQKNEKNFFSTIIQGSDERLSGVIKESCKEIKEQHADIIIVPIDDVRSFKHISEQELASSVKSAKNYQSVNLQDFLFYSQTHSENNPALVNEFVKNNYGKYLNFINEMGIKDINRSESFLRDVFALDTTLIDSQAIKENPFYYFYVPENQKTSKNCLEAIELMSQRKQISNLIISPKVKDHFIPKSLTTEELKNVVGTLQECLYKEKQQSTELDYSETLEKYKIFKLIPDNYHENMDLSFILDKNAYAHFKVTTGKEFTPEEAELATRFFAQENFFKSYDPIGADLFGELTGCEFEVYNGNLANPINCFSPDTLSLSQWHEIAAINSRMFDYIPSSILEKLDFWKNYEDFIGKGDYLKHPDNEYKYGLFDEREVFSKMPEVLKKDPKVYNTLLSAGAVSLNFIKEKDENIYLQYGYKNYYDIPEAFKVKENFKEVAQKAVEHDAFAIQYVPEKFITDKMIEKAVLTDVILIDCIPKEKLFPSLIEKIVESSAKQMMLIEGRMHEPLDVIKHEMDIRSNIIADLKKNLSDPVKNKSQELSI